MKQKILGIFPHLSLILSLMLLTFAITDRFNSAMAFINHPMTKHLICVLSVFNLLSAVRLCLVNHPSGRPFRLIIAIGWGLVSLLTAGLLIFDYISPSYILFTKDIVKLHLCLLAAASVLCSILLIAVQRKAVLKESEQ